MHQIEASQVREIRTKAYKYRACDEPEEHVWVRLSTTAIQAVGGHYEQITVLILCEKCGRTPLESLSELRVDPGLGGTIHD